jgi:hypothetical protein
MYVILENPSRMTKKEMRKEFAGKWVFAVEGDFDIGVPLKTAIPMVLADSPWEGREDGVYTRLKEQYERTAYFSFLTNEINVFGFTEVVANV